MVTVAMSAAVVALGACGASDSGSVPADTTVPAVVTTPSTVPPTAAPTTAAPAPPPVTVFTFAAPDSVDGWRTNNDTVMGGVSTSGVGWADGAMLFTGDLSLATTVASRRW